MGYGSGWNQVTTGGEKAQSTGVHNFFLSSGEVKRLLFVDDEPFCFWEHGTYGLSKTFETHLCLKRNQIEDGCPFCDQDQDTVKARGLWPTFVGTFTVIDLGYCQYGPSGFQGLEPYVSKEGKEYQFHRRIYKARRGSDAKPGMLLRLRTMLERKTGGHAKGVVVEVSRSGSKTESIGDSIEFVERVAEKDWVDYMVRFGARAEDLDLDPVDFMSMYKPNRDAMLAALRAGGIGGGSGGGKLSHDEVPF